MPCQDLGHQRETTSLITLGSAGNLFHEPTRLLGSGDFLVFRFFLNKPSLESFILERFFTELGDQFNSSLSQCFHLCFHKGCSVRAVIFLEICSWWCSQNHQSKLQSFQSAANHSVNQGCSSISLFPK